MGHDAGDLILLGPCRGSKMAIRLQSPYNDSVERPSRSFQQLRFCMQVFHVCWVGDFGRLSQAEASERQLKISACHGYVCASNLLGAGSCHVLVAYSSISISSSRWQQEVNKPSQYIHVHTNTCTYTYRYILYIHICIHMCKSVYVYVCMYV